MEIRAIPEGNILSPLTGNAIYLSDLLHSLPYNCVPLGRLGTMTHILDTQTPAEFESLVLPVPPHLIPKKLDSKDHSQIVFLGVTKIQTHKEMKLYNRRK
ncbi:hypothetical protein AVEN_54049-1 [Araneus ventricosus]|uniref:Uncharacterized protein n=1 Tax=Araneus ventricosus TaxID=182803 RepID=A0A4Y2EK00_ARAVE|nr:hypothetical protein AVEN_54049-1 [Araneus ventricosus]